MAHLQQRRTLINISGSQAIINIGSGFKYLIAAYDGQNSGAVLWDISALPAGTTLDIPAFALPSAGGTDLVNGADPQKYGITTWSMFNPGSTHVPDGARRPCSWVPRSLASA